MFEYFCPFLSLTIITEHRSSSILADGLLNLTPETKIVLNIFTAKSGSFFQFCIILLRLRAIRSTLVGYVFLFAVRFPSWLLIAAQR